MLSLYKQIRHELEADYNNGLYGAYKFNFFSTINNLYNVHLTDFQLNIFIEDDMIYDEESKLLIGRAFIPRLLLIVNRYTPDWLISNMDEDLSSPYLCRIHRQVTQLPLRDIYRVYEWSGHFVVPEKEAIVSNLLEEEYSSPIQWYESFVPLFKKIRPFKHGNNLVLYVLFVRECLKHNYMPPILDGLHFVEINSGNMKKLLDDATNDIYELRY